jgi:hypothetical protein
MSILNSLAEDNSRLAKEAILKANQDNKLLKDVIKLALDPFTQFYIRKIPEYTTIAEKKQDPLYKAILRLNLLSTRMLTGNAGIDHLRIVLSSVCPGDAKVIERIIAKDLKCGVSDATVNKIWPGLIPEYPCMLASAYDQKLVDRVKYPAFAQLKMDGMRFNAIVKNKSVEYRSRNGKEINLLGNLDSEFIEMSGGLDIVFDGELTVKKDGEILDRKTGNGILNKAVKGTISEAEAAMVTATIWDRIPLEKFEAGVDNTPYVERLGFLQLMKLDGRVNIVESQTVNSIDEARTIFEKYLSEGQEGIILKTFDGPWENKRSKSLIKFKGELECDLRVVDWEEGTGKNVGRLGALVLESDCGNIRVNVGTGFSDNDRNIITPESSVGRIVAIKYNARIKDKNSDIESLFLPVFVEFREDKSVADSATDIK